MGRHELRWGDVMAMKHPAMGWRLVFDMPENRPVGRGVPATIVEYRVSKSNVRLTSGILLPREQKSIAGPRRYTPNLRRWLPLATAPRKV